MTESTRPTPASDPVSAALAASKPLFAAAFGFSAAMSLLALTTSFYMLQVYDRVLSSRSVDTLLLLTLIAVVALAVFGALDSLRLRLLMRTGMRVAEALSPPVLRAMVAATSQTGDQGPRSGLRDIDTLRNFIGSPVLGALFDAPFVLVYLIVLLLLSPFFLLIVGVGAGILIAIAFFSEKLTKAPVSRSILLAMRGHAFAEDGLRNADVLEGMGMSSAFVARWRAQWLEGLRSGTAALDRDSRLSAASKTVRMLIQILLLGTGALLILDFQATGGIMIGASIIGARALAPIEALVGSWKSIIAVRQARDRLVTLLTAAPRRDEGMPLPAPAGRLQAFGASYAIAATRRVVLSNVTLDLLPGEALGVVGPSACGKSTLLRLLVGAWPCTSGSVRLDGADIYAWPRGELSPHIGYLPQDVELFAGTVRENIARMTAGDPQAVARAAQAAGAHQMILELPKGYDTEIGVNGQALSGGQSQRVGIARALYGDPRLVVLDEPNANLDGPGEDMLLTTLAGLKARGATTIIAAHRPSIIAGVDKMLVLRANGTVDVFGRRDQVMQHLTNRANAARAAQGDAPPGAPS